MPRQTPSAPPAGIVLRMRPHGRGTQDEQTYIVTPEGTVHVAYTQASYSEQSKKGFGAKTTVWRILPEGPTARHARAKAENMRIMGKARIG